MNFQLSLLTLKNCSYFHQRLRAAVSLGLVLTLFLTTLSTSVSAKKLPAPSDGTDSYVVYVDSQGDMVCREATGTEKERLEKVVPKDLRRINHPELMNSVAQPQSQAPENAVGHLTIILDATARLDANAAAKAAFTRAAANWENRISSPVTLHIQADLGPDFFSDGNNFPTGVLGSTTSPRNPYNYAVVRDKLINVANTASKLAVYNSLPTATIPTDLGNNDSVLVSRTLARAIGLMEVTATADDAPPRIGFNSTISFDFDDSNGVSSQQFDFEAIATHEIGHALGFSSASGANGTPTPTMWDLYRFRSGTTAGTFTTSQRIMTIGGPTTNSQYFFFPGIATELGLSDGGPNQLTSNNADGNQSSHWRERIKNGGQLIGIMDPTIPRGVHRDINDVNDIGALDLFGYNSNLPGPPANDNFANAQTITGCSGTINGINVAASKEGGEQNHSPDNNGGTHSVWYQWQAVANTDVTIDTATSGFDTVLGVYTGNAVNSLTLVKKNDDAQAGNTSSLVNFSTTAGVTYRIAVDGYNNVASTGGETGPFALHWNQSNCTNNFVPAQLTSNQVELKTWTMAGRTSAYVKLTFPNAGFRVVNWGTPVQAGNAFTVDAAVESFNGPSAQVISNTANIYDLGPIAAGDYTFTFKTSGATAKTLAFTVTFQTPPANPIDDPREFVRWQYKDFLRREPDAPGWDHWTGEITQCADAAFRLAGESEATCVDRKRTNTSGAFFLSPEFQNTGYFVLRVYRGSLGRMPHYGGGNTAADEFTRDSATVSQGIVVNDALVPATINANKQAFANDFVTRAEFRAIYDGLNNTQYVDKLFQTTGVTPSASDRQALIDGLTAGTLTRAQVLFNVVDGTQTGAGGALTFNTTYGKAFYDALFNQAFVQMEYFGYLLRDPDPDGYAFWLGKLNVFGNFVDAEMVRAFIVSPEYRSRFGAP